MELRTDATKRASKLLTRAYHLNSHHPRVLNLLADRLFHGKELARAQELAEVEEETLSHTFSLLLLLTVSVFSSLECSEELRGTGDSGRESLPARENRSGALRL